MLTHLILNSWPLNARGPLPWPLPSTTSLKSISSVLMSSAIITNNYKLTMPLPRAKSISPTQDHDWKFFLFFFLILGDSFIFFFFYSANPFNTLLYFKMLFLQFFKKCISHVLLANDAFLCLTLWKPEGFCTLTVSRSSVLTTGRL